MDELRLMPMPLIRRICELKAEESAPQDDWADLDNIPEPENPDGPPNRDQFIAYACSCGASQKWAEAEYERQVAQGGYGKAMNVQDGSLLYDARPRIDAE